MAISFEFPPAGSESSCCRTAFGLPWIFRRFNRCVVGSRCCFSLHFPDDIQCGTSLHVLTCRLCVSFGERSGKVCRRRRWHPTPVLLPGKSHGWRSLVGCSPWGRKESDTTERLHFHFSLSRIGEGNGNPLQCSCLENPRDGGAWWAAVYGVAQSWTRLKQLSSSSSEVLWPVLSFSYQLFRRADIFNFNVAPT